MSVAGEQSEPLYGLVTERRPFGSGFAAKMGTYFVRSSGTQKVYYFDYTDIVTEGFRTISTGERIRFRSDPEDPDHATYVIRLEERNIEDFYG